jgi:hypothetical protein
MEKVLEEVKNGLKRVLRLDKNFHVYIHGNLSKFEMQEEEKGKYIKIYYNEIEYYERF